MAADLKDHRSSRNLRGGFRVCLAAIACLSGMVASCTDLGNDMPGSRFSSDEALFLRVTGTDPFTSYVLFPRVDSLTSGTLNGSNAHQPLVRVRLNAKAFGVLQNGSLPAGARFPDGSVLFKEIIMDGRTVLYAVICKDTAHPLSANGWLWAEYGLDGTAVFSVASQGSGCVSCHAREQGPQHDYVRTFERQR